MNCSANISRYPVWVLLIGVLWLQVCCCNSLKAQDTAPVFAKDAIAENKTLLYNNLVNNAILKNLSVELTDSTAADWAYAFSVMELIRYQSPWVQSRIYYAINEIENRPVYFQRALMELLFTNYPNQFSNQVLALMDATKSDQVFAMCAEYLLKSNAAIKQVLISKAKNAFQKDSSSVVLQQLCYQLSLNKTSILIPNLQSLFYHPFFKNATVVFSLHHSNRDYPGLAIIRDSAGNFVKDIYGNIFSLPQLARSINNMPSYLSNGNTPQGIYRMKGLAVSRSNFIGPTPNIQLTMPVETSIADFFNDSSITDSLWSLSYYQQLLPDNWKNYDPIFESYFAGKAGRTEIIAHGSTINPDYYRGQPYYPITPTLGCLSTMEIWSDVDGSRQKSNQQQLVNALKQAGGADGYLIVLDISDDQKPVTLSEILSWIK